MRLRSILAASAIGLSATMISGSAMAAGNTDLTSLTVAETFPAWQSTVTSELKTGGGYQFYSNFAKVTASVKYDPVGQTYTVRDTGSAAATTSFGSANITSSTSDYTYYGKTVGSTTHTLKLLNPGAGNTTIALTYTSYGAWQRTTPGAGWNGATKINDTYFVFGKKTPTSGIPLNGGADYSTVLDGSFVNATKSYTVSGTGTLHASWSGAGSISYSATASGVAADLSVLNFGTMAGTGSIYKPASSFTGFGTTNIQGYKMGLSGYFFGPTAQEIGAVFRLQGGGGSGTGALVGKQ